MKKFGFRFFFSEGRRDIDGVLELGASTFFTTPTYQIDRGIFENFLGEHARQQAYGSSTGSLSAESNLARARLRTP